MILIIKWIKLDSNCNDSIDIIFFLIIITCK